MTEPGYHLRHIEKGELGEVSKILEEANELLDAHEQGVKIMALVELSDLLGAINAYLTKHHPGTDLKDLQEMSAVTARAFRSGTRQPRDVHVTKVGEPTEPVKAEPITAHLKMDYDHVPDINYDRLSTAVDFYRQHNFQYIAAPWIVPQWAIDATLPEGEKSTQSSYGPLVGSAEQSFAYMYNRDQGNDDDELSLVPGRYIAVTPCFRCDPEDSTHFKYFMKAELFSNEAHDLSPEGLTDVITLAVQFFSRYIPGGVKVVKTGVESYDIVTADGLLELGSYGIRSHSELGIWLYGTACAEPRLSQAARRASMQKRSISLERK